MHEEKFWGYPPNNTYCLVLKIIVSAVLTVFETLKNIDFSLGGFPLLVMKTKTRQLIF